MSYPWQPSDGVHSMASMAFPITKSIFAQSKRSSITALAKCAHLIHQISLRPERLQALHTESDTHRESMILLERA